MKSIIKNVISILVITVIGMFVGYYIGSSKNGIGRAAEDKMEYNKTIAIVNLDEGIEVQGNEENYGMRLTDMVSDDIIVTGLEDARKGVEYGIYSAYLVIPSAFSQNIATITDKPVKSVLSYTIGKNLEGEERETVIYRVEDILEVFRSNISKVYLASILAEYHEAQDSASTIITNDATDMELLQEVQGEDLIAYIEVPEATKVENTISELDLQENYTATHDNTKKIGDAYRSYYTEGKEDLENIRQDFQSVDDSMTEYQTSVNDLRDTVKGIINNKWDDSELVKKEEQAYEAVKKELVGTVENQENETEEKEEGILVKYNNILEPYRQAVTEKLDEYDTVENKYRELIATLQEHEAELEEIGIEIPDPGEDIEKEIIVNGEVYTEIPQVDVAEVEQKLDSLIQTAVVAADSRKQVLDEKMEEWQASGQKIDDVDQAYITMRDTYKEKNKVLAEFDLTKYIDDNEIDTYLSNIDKSLDDVEEKVKDQENDYEKYASDVYEAAENDIDTFEKRIEDGQAESEQKLFEGLESAKKSRAENSMTNHQLLNTLISRLPYTRLGDLENKTVYDFIASPFETQKQSE